MVTTLSSLRSAYHTAKLHDDSDFVLDGRLFVTTFAGYLIEFLEYRGFPDDREITFTKGVN